MHIYCICCKVKRENYDTKKIIIIIPVISRAFLISSVSSIPVTLIPVNGSFPCTNNCNT